MGNTNKQQLKITADKTNNPLEDIAHLDNYVEELNKVIQTNPSFLKANLNIEQLSIDVAVPESNFFNRLIPSLILKNSTVIVQYTLIQTGQVVRQSNDGIEESKEEEGQEMQEEFLIIRQFDKVGDFVQTAAKLIKILDHLADYNLKFQSNVEQFRAQTMKIKKDEREKILQQMEKASSRPSIAELQNTILEELDGNQGKIEQEEAEAESNEVEESKTVDIQKSDDDEEMNLCQICYDRQIQIAIEPCLHSFCNECIYNWTKVNETCPICRAKTKKVMTQEQIDQEARDELLVQLTQSMREVLDDEQKRLQASLKMRQQQIEESRRRDQEQLRELRNSRR